MNFGKVLQALMNKAEIKNAVLAEALQYDVSYISKWISGKALPSEKSIDSLCRQIIHAILQNQPPCVADILCKEYHLGQTDNMQEELADMLLKAYTKDKEIRSPRAKEILVLPVITDIELVHSLQVLTQKPQEEMNLIAVVDLFALQNESRLFLSGIEQGHFSFRQAMPGVHFSMVISIDETEFYSRDIVYDCISLIHMLTGLSQLDFALYSDPYASGKFIFSADNDFYVSAVHLGLDRQWFTYTKNASPESASQIYASLQSRLSVDQLVFRKRAFRDMLNNREYIQSIISTDIRWLLGHATEIFLPDDLFEELLLKIPSKYTGSAALMRQAHSLTQNLLNTGSHISIMIYTSAFYNLALSGELDFFNIPIILSLKQRLRYMEFMELFVQKHKNTGNLKLVEEGFSTDFKYITNPCLFLSDSLGYLRLENDSYRNNILIINSTSISTLFCRFYDCIWKNRPDVVISEPAVIMGKLRHYVNTVRLLLYAEKE